MNSLLQQSRTVRWWSSVSAFVAVALALGCNPASRVKESSPETEAEASVDEDPRYYLEVDVEMPPGGEAATVSVPGISDHQCVGRLDRGEERTIELSDWAVRMNGYRLSFDRKGEGGSPLILGVIADIKEDTAENLFNIGRFIEWWLAEGVEAVVLAGDGGDTSEGLSRVLGLLAEPGWPIFVINGNRECKDVYVAGVAMAQESYPNVFNIGQQRVVDLPGATLLALPGYHDSRFLHAENGCRYFQWDVASLVPKARESTPPVVLVAHSGPRGATPRAIDYAREAGNVGDANINRLIISGGIAFGIFAHIHEAGGKATDLFGENIVEAGEYADSFYLNVGPADSLPWAMNDRSESRGMAGIVRIDGERAAYRINRLPALTSEQAAEAAGLVE